MFKSSTLYFQLCSTFNSKLGKEATQSEQFDNIDIVDISYNQVCLHSLKVVLNFDPITE